MLSAHYVLHAHYCAGHVRLRMPRGLHSAGGAVDHQGAGLQHSSGCRAAARIGVAGLQCVWWGGVQCAEGFAGLQQEAELVRLEVEAPVVRVGRNHAHRLLREGEEVEEAGGGGRWRRQVEEGGGGGRWRR